MKKPIILAAFLLVAGWSAAQSTPQKAMVKQTSAKAEEKNGNKTLISTSKREAKKKSTSTSEHVMLDVSAYLKDTTMMAPEPKKEK